jgi:G3E family GTPase
MPEKSRIPVTVITGFLGSGKTTLLNHILKGKDHGMKIAVIENEFGEVGVDDALLRTNKLQGAEEIVEMNNGCICCTVRGDLIKMLGKLKDRQLDLVLIETTGLADPAPVAQTFFVDEQVSAYYVLDSIVTIVDCKHIDLHLDDKKEDGVENEAVEQIAFADVVLLNKIDLVDRKVVDNVRKRIQGINSQVEIIETVQSCIDPSRLLNKEAFNLERVLEFDPEFLKDTEHQHDLSITSVGFAFDYDLELGKLNALISVLMKEKGTDLFRYKGVIPVKGMDDRFVFQGVHMLFGGNFTTPWADEPRKGRFIFIGRNLDKKELTRAFEACKAKDLRFKVNDRVFVNVSRGYTPGVVKKVWDEGNAYRVRVRSLKTDVWAPEDDDRFIKAG